jgi:putative flavoprotein involved in K+ transport
MTMPEVVDHLSRYASSFDAPVLEGVEVRTLRPHPVGFEMETSVGTFHARTVVAATGGSAAIPPIARNFSPTIDQLHSSRYRNPDGIRPGGVLVVGGSASGLQIAIELARSGRWSTSRSAGTRDSPAPTGDGASTGGWTCPAPSTERSTRCPISMRHDRNRRCS